MANPVALGNITFPLPPSGGVAWITCYFSKQLNEVGCFIRLIDKPIGHDLYQSLSAEKESIEADIPFQIKWDNEKRMIIRCIQVTSEWPPVENTKVDQFFTETINGLINTFRPRLERLSGN
jgi:hypothetical protein